MAKKKTEIKEFTELKKKFADLHKQVIAEFCAYLKSYFSRYPYLNALSWDIWAPSFNDGEPCYPNVNKFRFSIKNDRLLTFCKAAFDGKFTHIETLDEDSLEELLDECSDGDFGSRECDIKGNDALWFVPEGLMTEQLKSIKKIMPDFKDCLDEGEQICSFIEEMMHTFIQEFGEPKTIVATGTKMKSFDCDVPY